MSVMTEAQTEKFHQAAKMIESDGVEAYQTVYRRFGKDIAGAVLVAFLRSQFSVNEGWPVSEEVREKTNGVLRENGILVKGCPHQGGHRIGICVEEAAIEPKSDWQQPWCQFCSSPSTNEAVFQDPLRPSHESRIRCCENPACQQEAKRMAISIMGLAVA